MRCNRRGAPKLRLAELALASARAERSEDRTKDRYRVAAVHRLVGDVHLQLGDPGAAKAAWTAGLAQLPRNVPERPAEMHERAEILKRLGRAHEARPLHGRLSAIGFKSTT